MRFCLPDLRSLITVLVSLFLSLDAFSQEPSWDAGYPQVMNGASSITINVDMNASGSVYYAIYNAAQGSLTSAQLKSDALTGSTPGIIRHGSVAVTANVVQAISETALTSNTTYYVYAIGESAGGLMSNSKISGSQAVLPQREQGFYNFSNSSMNSYLMYFPEPYYMDKNKYPLLIFLNGDAEMSKGGAPNPYLLLENALPQIINEGRDLPMVVASPQGIWAWDNTEADLDSYIEFLKANYRVDPSQIFLTGISAGGKGVFQYTNVYTTKIKAIVPISTWPEPTDVHNFVNVPVWAFMGNSDTNGGLINWIADLKALGAQATYTGYPGAHDPSVWNAVYSGSRGDDIYTWMLTRGQTVNKPPVVNAGADVQITLPQNSIQLTGTATDPDGTILSVLWTEISGPAATLTNATTTQLSLSGLSAGTYVFQFSAKDNAGATSSDQMTLTVNASGSVVTREFDINLTWEWNLQGGTWNDFITTNGGTVGNSSVLFDNTKKTSSVSLSVVSNFVDGTNNHGVTPGVYPNNVMMYYLRSSQTNIGMLKLSGLDVTKLYDFALLSSNVDGWYPSDTKFTVGTQSAVVNGTNNASTLVNFSSVAPSGAGEIYITVAPATTNTANNGIINSIILKEKTNGSTNTPPVVNAGADQQFTLPLSQIVLNGTASDPDGTIASVLWTKISGPAVTLTNTATLALTLTNLVAGTYTFQLSATDNSGATTADQVVVTINPANVPPVVNAGADQNFTLPLSQIQLTGTATDPDGTIASVLWTKISGPAITLSNQTTKVLTLTNILAGSYVFQLSATDNSGATSTDQVAVTVHPANVPPVVNAGADQQFTLPLTQIQLTATATDPDGTIASVLWTEVSGPAATFSGANTKILTITNIVAGTYLLQFSATDNSGATSTDQVVVTVNPAVVVSAREFDVNLTWEWNLQGGGWNDFVTTNGGTAGTSAVLFDNKNASSGITLSILANFVDGVNNHGVVPGLYPTNVMQYYLRSTTTSVGVLKLSGLDVTKQYDFSVLASNEDVWYPSTTTLTIGSQAVTVDAKSNSSKLATFTNLSPNSSGVLTITVAPSTTSTSNNGVINAFIMTEHGAGSGSRIGEAASAQTEPPAPRGEGGDFISLYPNPVEEYVTLEINNPVARQQDYTLRFLDSKGSAIYSSTVAGKDNDNRVVVKIAADFMQTGFYILTVTSPQSGIHYLKVIKK